MTSSNTRQVLVPMILSCGRWMRMPLGHEKARAGGVDEAGIIDSYNLRAVGMAYGCLEAVLGDG